MKKNNKTCILCGKKYTFCNRCEEFDRLPRWMGIYCSDNCRKVFNILTDYNSGHVNKGDTLKKLQDCDLSDKDNYNKFNKGIINELFGVQNEESEKVDIEESDDAKADIEKVDIDNTEKTLDMKTEDFMNPPVENDDTGHVHIKTKRMKVNKK